MTIVLPADAASLAERLISFAADFDVTVREPAILSISSNVVVHLRPSPIVARVANITAEGRDRPDLALGREVALADHLLAEGVATVAPSSALPAGPHDVGGWWASFFAHEELAPVRDGDAERVGHALVGLHRAAVTLDDPRFDRTIGDETAVLLDRLRGRIPGADHELLRVWADDAVVDLVPVQPLHADPHRGNVGRRADGTIVWFDLDDAVRDSTLVDLATLHRSWPEAGRAACRRAEVDPDGVGVRRATAQREMWGGIWAQFYGLGFPDTHAAAAAAVLASRR